MFLLNLDRYQSWDPLPHLGIRSVPGLGSVVCRSPDPVPGSDVVNVSDNVSIFIHSKQGVLTSSNE